MSPTSRAGAIASYIAQQSRGEALKPVIIDNLCYMLVNNSPRFAQIFAGQQTDGQ
jgi:hypothetical protein